MGPGRPSCQTKLNKEWSDESGYDIESAHEDNAVGAISSMEPHGLDIEEVQSVHVQKFLRHLWLL